MRERGPLDAAMRHMDILDDAAIGADDMVVMLASALEVRLTRFEDDRYKESCRDERIDRPVDRNLVEPATHAADIVGAQRTLGALKHPEDSGAKRGLPHPRAA